MQLSADTLETPVHLWNMIFKIQDYILGENGMYFQLNSCQRCIKIHDRPT